MIPVDSPLGGVSPLQGASRRRMPGAPGALGAATTGANGAAGGLPGAAPEVPGGAPPFPPMELGDAKPMTTGGAVPIGDAPTAGPFSAAPASRGQGSPFLSPQPPTPPQMPMPSYGGFPLAGGMGGGSGGYAQTTNYGPGADLRSTQINPADSAATQGANTAAQTAMGNYASFQANPWQSVGAGSYTPGADTTQSRSALMQALQSLSGGPDRGQLAAQNFNLLDQTAAEASARDQRTIGQSAAKFGRIGSGITTTNLGDLGERQAIDRSRAQSQMSLDAAGQTMQDNLNRVGAIGGVTSLLGGEDRGNAGVDLGLRNEARGERDASNSYNAQDFTRKGQLFGDLATYGQQQTNNDAARRDELRTERGYQTGMEQNAYDRNNQAIDRAQSQSNNGLSQALALLGAGNGYDPSGLLASLGANQSAQAGQGAGDLASLIQNYIRSRSGGATG